MIGTEWMADAACRGTDTEAFFPEPEGPHNRDLVVKVCDGCPVKGECLQYSIEQDLDGWWGGKGGTERAQMRQAFGGPTALQLEQAATREEARSLFRRGFSRRDIAQTLGVSEMSVYRWIREGKA